MTITLPPALTAWTDGEYMTHTVVNSRIHDPLYYLLHDRPTCKLRATIAETLTNNTQHTIDFHWAEIDNTGMWTSASNNRITPRHAGVYKGWFGSSWYTTNTTASGSGRRVVQIHKNGSATYWRMECGPSDNPGLATPMVVKGIPFYVRMNGTTDYITMLQYQSNTPAVSMTTNVDGLQEMPEIFMRWFKRL